jgi:predicted amidophosphoribosyltransferase
MTTLRQRLSATGERLAGDPCCNCGKPLPSLRRYVNYCPACANAETTDDGRYRVELQTDEEREFDRTAAVEFLRILCHPKAKDLQ